MTGPLMMFGVDFQIFEISVISYFFKLSYGQNQKSIPHTTGEHFAVKNMCRIIL